jgi:hypothetical protein
MLTWSHEAAQWFVTGSVAASHIGAGSEPLVCSESHAANNAACRTSSGRHYLPARYCSAYP